MFKKGHDQDTRLWSDRAQSDPADLILQRLAEDGTQGIGYLDLLLTELEGFSLKYQIFLQLLEDVELQLGIPKTGS